MKNKSIALLIVLLCLTFASCKDSLVEDEVGEFTFDAEYYELYFADFTSEQVVGREVFFDNVETVQDLAASVDVIWLEVYEDYVLEQKPYIVEYDEENMLWYIRGNADYLKDGLGGVANSIVSKETGELLYIWHGE